MRAFCNTPGDFHMEKTALPHLFGANEKQQKSFKEFQMLNSKGRVLKEESGMLSITKAILFINFKGGRRKSFFFLQE